MKKNKMVDCHLQKHIYTINQSIDCNFRLTGTNNALLKMKYYK